MNVENKAHRAQAPVCSLFWCLAHLGLSSAVYETASFRHKTHEESFPACSLLFAALTLSQTGFQGEALISDLCTGLLVAHLQRALLSQLTKVQGAVPLGTRCVYIWLTNSLCCCTPALLLGHQPCGAVSGACLPAALARQGQGLAGERRGENVCPGVGQGFFGV